MGRRCLSDPAGSRDCRSHPHRWSCLRRTKPPGIRWRHVKVLLAIARCRTAALGGHLDECTRCGHHAPISYNSCRNRHCPKCQTAARERWIAARRRELLPTRYLHVVFTLPRYLAPLVLHNKKVLYDLLFRTSVSWPLAASRPITPVGCLLQRTTSCPRRSSASSFVASSWPPCGKRSETVSCTSPKN